MYDNVCKFLAENFPSDFACWIFGEPKELTNLSPTELSVEPIRADALILLQSEEVVLHLEFQTRPDESIPFRMADYQLLLREEIMQESVIYQDIKEQGIRQGQAILVLRLLKRRIGKLESEDETRILDYL